MEDDLAPSKTDGFKVGEKKTIDEYQKLGASDLTILPLVQNYFANRAGEVEHKPFAETGIIRGHSVRDIAQNTSSPGETICSTS